MLPKLLYTVQKGKTIKLHLSGALFALIHHSISASMIDMLHSSLSVATNYSHFVSTILCLYQQFSINNIVVANVVQMQMEGGVDSGDL